MSTENFYSDLPVVNNFTAISDFSIYSPLLGEYANAVRQLKEMLASF